MSHRQTLPGAIARYLDELEIAAKQCVGVYPNEILRDAQEHLLRDYEALQRAEPVQDDDALLQHFRESYGLPDEVAKSYEQFSDTNPPSIPACAPGWRIHCAVCGRSAPAAKVGITRIGARSIGKRVLGRCHGCKCLRWLRLTRDLNRAGTIIPGESIPGDSSEQLEASSAWTSARLIRLIIGIIVIGLALPWLIEFAIATMPAPFNQKAARVSKAPGLERLPAGWEIVSETHIQNAQLQQISGKLGIPFKALFNTVIGFDNHSVQINTITALNKADAVKLKAKLRQGKTNPRWVIQNNNVVYEFVVRTEQDARVASSARYAFPIEPRQRSYAISFDAIPIKSEPADSTPDKRNRLFNLILQASTKPDLQPQIEALSKGFGFADELKLTKELPGLFKAEWQAADAELRTTDDSETASIKVTKPKTRFGMPVQPLTARISLDTTQKRTIAPTLDRQPLLASNARFPTESAELVQLVGSIVKPTDLDSIKLRKLLDWFTDPQHMRYDGLTGSRYGTLNAYQQHFGRCWDYADLFITMARIAGLPSRQVYGWLYESEGHVWCDVIIDGHWQMVDPTSGTICGSDYLPLCVSADGEFPMIYASPVSITEL